MMRRSRRSLPAGLVALVLLAVAVLTAASCTQLLLDRAPLLPLTRIAEAAGAMTWNQLPVLVVAAAVALLGLVLLSAAVVPGAPTVLGLARRDGQPDAGATRRSLARALTAAARSVDGVSNASVRVRPRTIIATVHTPLHAAEGVPEQVRTAMTERLDDIALATPTRVRVRLKTGRST